MTTLHRPLIPVADIGEHFDLGGEAGGAFRPAAARSPIAVVGRALVSAQSCLYNRLRWGAPSPIYVNPTTIPVYTYTLVSTTHMRVAVGTRVALVLTGAPNSAPNL